MNSLVGGEMWRPKILHKKEKLGLHLKVESPDGINNSNGSVKAGALVHDTILREREKERKKG